MTGTCLNEVAHRSMGSLARAFPVRRNLRGGGV
jgi:hypothetical protein